MAKISEKLQNLTNAELLVIIEKLYLKNKENKIFLDTLFIDENNIEKYKSRLLTEIEKTFWIKGNLKSPTYETLKKIFDRLISINHDGIRMVCCLVYADELAHYISTIYQVNERYVTLLLNALDQCVNIVFADNALINKYVQKITLYDLDGAFVDIGEIANYCYMLTNKEEEEE